MPEGDRSEATLREQALVEWMDAMVEALQKTELMDPPLGMESVSPSEYRRRFRAMTPAERVEEMQRVGIPTVLKIFGADGKGE